MKLVITDIKSLADKRLITDLAERLGMKVSSHNLEYEDWVLGEAMKEANDGKKLSKKEALKVL